MAEIIWTDPALDELNEIAEYVALDNPAAAKVLVRTAFNVVARLEKFPRSGRVPPELEDLDYREVVTGPCRIFYKIVEEQVYIIFVLREERDLKRYLLGDIHKN